MAALVKRRRQLIDMRTAETNYLDVCLCHPDVRSMVTAMRKIINKQIPATIVYEDEKVLAFKDISPVAPVHILFIPKLHIENIQDLTPETVEYVAAIHLAAKKVAEDFKISDKGFRFISNCGSGAGQTVFHLHYHMIGGIPLGAKMI